MGGTIIYQKANFNECREIAILKGKVWNTTYRGIYPDEKLDNYDVDKYTKAFESIYENPELELYVAKIDDKIVGLMSYGKPYNPFSDYQQSIGLLYILDELQRKGVGTTLFNIAKEGIKRNGFDKFFVTVHKLNEKGGSFYKKMGGIEVKEDEEDKFFSYSI